MVDHAVGQADTDNEEVAMLSEMNRLRKAVVKISVRYRKARNAVTGLIKKIKKQPSPAQSPKPAAAENKIECEEGVKAKDGDKPDVAEKMEEMNVKRAEEKVINVGELAINKTDEMEARRVGEMSVEDTRMGDAHAHLLGPILPITAPPKRKPVSFQLPRTSEQPDSCVCSTAPTVLQPANNERPESYLSSTASAPTQKPIAVQQPVNCKPLKSCISNAASLPRRNTLSSQRPSNSKRLKSCLSSSASASAMEIHSDLATSSKPVFLLPAPLPGTEANPIPCRRRFLITNSLRLWIKMKQDAGLGDDKNFDVERIQRYAIERHGTGVRILLLWPMVQSTTDGFIFQDRTMETVLFQFGEGGGLVGE